MKQSDILGIPREIRKKLRAEDKSYRAMMYNGRNLTMFYSYFGYLKNGEFVKYTAAVKREPKTDRLMIKLVGVYDGEYTYASDMTYSYMSGYSVDWSEDIRTGRQHIDWANCTKGGISWNPSSIIINRDDLQNSKYKYSGYQYYDGLDLFKYLKIWEKHHGVEFLVKNDMSYLAEKKRIIKKCEQDKNFVKFLRAHKDYFRTESPSVDAIIKAYDNNASLELMDVFTGCSRRYEYIREIFKPKEAEKLLDYIVNTCGGCFDEYNDYLCACVKLGLDLTDTKNRYPKEFKRWHDMRISQYAMKRRTDVKKRFEDIAVKYVSMERNSTYCVIMAKSKDDLIKEGDALHHCVGQMDYDKRMVDEKSLIFFVREKRDVPFVTVEYSLQAQRVVQCYAEYDSKPEQKVLDFVYRDWQKYATRQLKKIRRAA